MRSRLTSNHPVLVNCVNLGATALCLALWLTPGHVHRVIDGDTIEVYTIAATPYTRIRVLGVDAWERHAVGGAEAAAFTATWLRAGDFHIEACGYDSFGRLLAAVTRPGDDLAARLIAMGHGKVYERR